MHVEAWQFVAWSVAWLERQGRAPQRVLEIGSRNINGSVRALFRCPYVGIDVEPGPLVDVVADGASYQPELPVDTVVCCEVLEHAPAAAAIVGHALELLPPGGILIVTCAAPERASHSGIDGGLLRAGEYYAGIRPDDLEAWVMAAGATRQVHWHDPIRGDLYLLAVKN
jgi:hypothetical protein